MLKTLSFLFNNRSATQTITKNSFWLFLAETTSYVLKIVIVIYAARILGSEGWGTFSYAITLAGFLSIISNLGLDTLVIREVSQKRDMKDQYISTIFFMKLFLFLISTSLIIFVAPHITKVDSVRSLLPIVALLLIFDGLREFGLFVNRASEKMELEALIKISTSFVVACLALVTLFISPSPKSLALAYLNGSILGFILSAWLLKHHFKNLFIGFSRKLVGPILSATWPLALSGVLGGIMVSTDIFMLGWLSGASEIGLYSVAQRPVQLFYIIPGVLSAALFPTISRLIGQNKRREFRAVLEKSMSASLLLGIPIVLGGLILGGELIPFLFGEQYLSSVLTFRILLLTILMGASAALIGNALISSGEQKVFAVYTTIGALTNVLLNVILIPRYGIVGAAIATILSQVLINSLFLLKMKRINYFVILPYLKRIIISGTSMSILTFGIMQLGVSVIINILISAIFYFLLLKFLNEPLLKDAWSIIRSK